MFEITAIVFGTLKIIMVSLYHPPANDSLVVLDLLDKLLCVLSKWINYSNLVGGGFNSDFRIT